MKELFRSLPKIDQCLAVIGIIVTLSFSTLAYFFADGSQLVWFLILLSASCFFIYLEVACDNIKIPTQKGVPRDAVLFVKKYKKTITFFIAALNNIVDIVNTLVINAIFSTGLNRVHPGLDSWSDILSVILTLTVMLSLGDVIPKNIAKTSPNSGVSMLPFMWIRRLFSRLKVEDLSEKEVIKDAVDKELYEKLAKLLNYEILANDKARHIFQLLTKEGFLHPNILLNLSEQLAEIGEDQGKNLEEILGALKLNQGQRIYLRKELKLILPNLGLYGIRLTQDETVYFSYQKSA